MTMVLLPVGKIVYVCDDVVADPVSHKPSVLNLWEVVRVPAGASFPYTLEKLCVVSLMRDGQGKQGSGQMWSEPTPRRLSAEVRIMLYISWTDGDQLWWSFG